MLLNKAAWQGLPVKTGPDRHSRHTAATTATATSSHSLTGPVATAALMRGVKGLIFSYFSLRQICYLCTPPMTGAI